jgi:hypothetical protein
VDGSLALEVLLREVVSWVPLKCLGFERAMERDSGAWLLRKYLTDTVPGFAEQLQTYGSLRNAQQVGVQLLCSTVVA